MDDAPATQLLPLPSGAVLSVRADETGEDIRVRSADGRMELSIRMTADGPVLSLRGVRLEIEAADTVALSCRELAITTREGMRVQTGGAFEVRAARDAAIDADYVKINCGDRTGYHDANGE